MQLQQPKPFPLQVHEFSDYLDVFGAWCVLGAWRRSAGIGERGKKIVYLFVCDFVNFISTAMRSQGCLFD